MQCFMCSMTPILERLNSDVPLKATHVSKYVRRFERYVPFAIFCVFDLFNVFFMYLCVE